MEKVGICRGLIYQAHLIGGYRMINKKKLLIFGIGILILVASVFLVSRDSLLHLRDASIGESQSRRLRKGKYKLPHLQHGIGSCV
jgi:hypothetical protein